MNDEARERAGEQAPLWLRAKKSRRPRDHRGACHLSPSRAPQVPPGMAALALQPDHAYVLASFIGMYLVNQILGATVGAARAKYGVKPPNLYASPGLFLTKEGLVDAQAFEDKGNKFNQVQRGHQHLFEMSADAYAMLGACGLFYPAFASRCAVLFMVGTLLYAYGYSLGPKYRLIGEFFYFPAFVGWIWGLGSAAMAIHAGKPW